jgi:methyl-accepting chemotaxis protein
MTTDINKGLQLKQGLAEQAFQNNNQAYQSARVLIIGVVVASILLGIIMSIVIARGFAVPLGHAAMVLERVAEGDLTVRSQVHTKDEVGRMADALNRAMEKLDFTMQEVADSAANASTSSQELAAAAEAIASGAQEQAASLEETSASLEEITATVRQTADNAKQANQLANSSKDSAQQGQEVVSNAITAMAEINAASAKISDIISTIDEIAFQTNLLAVNAAVEAARAGDEGRGFAVVASEVRSLAQRSAVAAKEIKVLIQDSLRKVDAGSGLVNRSGETLQGIVGSVKRVTDIVGEIAAASGEQSTGIEQVNTAMTQMDQVTQSNSAQTEELSATAQALSEQAAHLMELVSTFTLSQAEKNTRERQTFLPHETNPAHFVGASLVHSAMPNLGQSASPSQATQRPSKAARGNSPSRPSSRPRSNKGLNSGQPALAVAISAAPSRSGANDASFEEF